VRKCPKELVSEDNSDRTRSESPLEPVLDSDSTEGLVNEDLSEDQESELLLNQDVENSPEEEPEDPSSRQNVWSGRLRSRQRVESQS